MAKRKSKKQLEKHISSSSLANNREDDWVIVKKQRVTILIPLLHQCEPTTACAADLCANTIGEITTKDTKKKLLSSEPEDELKLAADGIPDHISPCPETSSQFPLKAHLKELNLEKGEVSGLPAARIPHTRDEPDEVQVPQRPLKRPKRLLIGATGGVFLNQTMRASNLDRKIQRAGGLSNWMASLGLQQFVRLFNRRKVDKVQLVNLTMKKLRDMGAIAVGPRRKLMHAIDCLCQPYCFEIHHIAPIQLH